MQEFSKDEFHFGHKSEYPFLQVFAFVLEGQNLVGTKHTDISEETTDDN